MPPRRTLNKARSTETVLPLFCQVQTWAGHLMQLKGTTLEHKQLYDTLYLRMV